jgi:hypothetical protein
VGMEAGGHARWFEYCNANGLVGLNSDGRVQAKDSLADIESAKVAANIRLFEVEMVASFAGGPHVRPG